MVLGLYTEVHANRIVQRRNPKIEETLQDGGIAKRDYIEAALIDIKSHDKISNI